MSPQTETKGDVTPARNHSLTGETASSDAVEASKTVSNSEPPDESEAFNANPGGTSFKPSAALGQTWQQNIGSGSQRNASPMTRSVPKEVQDRLKKKVRNSPPSEILGLDEFCAVPESQKRSEDMELQSEEQQWADAVTKEKVAGSGDDTLHRAPLVKGSGPASLVAFAASPKSDVEPKRCASVAQNTASCNAGACNYESSLDGAACGLNSSSPSARCSSSSKESSHRKERPCRENAIPDGTLPSGHGASADGTKSIRTSRNDGAVRAGNHKQSADSRNNLSSEARSSTAGDPSVIVLMPKDADPDHDPKDHEKCEPGCCLM